LHYFAGHSSDSRGQVDLVLATFTTDANGNASITFNMSPGGYKGGYFTAITSDGGTRATATVTECGTTGATHYSIIKASQVTIVDDAGGSPGDRLAWGKADYTMRADDHLLAAVELHGAAPNTIYHTATGELSCAYAQDDIKTDANGDAKQTLDLFGSCGGTLYLTTDGGERLVAGFVVK
jgi:hypothetical protein